MELRLKPSERNQYELKGILIKGDSVKTWLLELQRMKLDYRQVSLYPVPGSAPNTLWACLVLFRQAPDPALIGKNEWCQQLSSSFFIAERSQVFPAMTVPEMEQLFKDAVWLMHPETGLVALTEVLPLKQLLVLPEKAPVDPVTPMQSFIPSEIKSFQLAPVKAEEALQKLEESFPKTEKMEDKPLSLLEKARLSFYKALFTKPGLTGKSAGESDPETPREESAFGNLVNFITQPFMKGGKDFSDRVEPDLEELQRRNQKQIDKLLDMLKNNPEEALKYAIPLDQEGSSRGTNKGSLDLSQRRTDFSLFSNSGRIGGGGGGSVDIGEHFYTLEQQYRQTAEQLIRDGNFEKAAFIYMKLLKLPRVAAQTLEEGKYYADAASIYLKFANDKHKAAECYEKGNLHANAIELYKELKNYEHVGDLYILMNQKKEAEKYYEITADNLIQSNQYISASTVYRNKMGDAPRANNLLLKGWRENKDGAGCLKVYFTQVPDPDKLGEELQQLYQHDVNKSNQLQFLQVLKSDSLKLPELEEQKREMAFEIIADGIHHNPSLVKELHFFNPENKGLPKDTSRFVIGQAKSQRKGNKQ